MFVLPRTRLSLSRSDAEDTKAPLAYYGDRAVLASPGTPAIERGSPWTAMEGCESRSPGRAAGAARHGRRSQKVKQKGRYGAFTTIASSS